MKYILAATAVVLPLALGSADATTGRIDETPISLIERHFEHLAYIDFAGYQAMRAALDPSSKHGNPKNASFEATELDNYGHAWVYLSALVDYDPRSTLARQSKRAYACYLTARRNAMPTAGNEGSDVTGTWLDLADRCAASLRTTLLLWAERASVPLGRADLQGTAPYRMFFPFDAATITAIGDNILHYIARFERTGETVQFVVEGHADRSGDEAYNMVLSKQRADAVGSKFTAYMKNDPVHQIQAVGETKPLAPTQDGIRHPRNRRVEIMIDRL